MSDEDSKAIYSSQIIQEYLKNEMLKRARLKAEAQRNAMIAENTAFDDFNEFEQRVRSDKKLAAVFSSLRAKIASDESYRNSLDQNFVNGIMLLNLD